MVCFSICLNGYPHSFFTWPTWGTCTGKVYIFEKQGNDFRSPSVAKELIPFEDEFRLTKWLVVLNMSLVFATPVTMLPYL